MKQVHADPRTNASSQKGREKEVFFRDAEADALHMERCQLDKATLIACAVKRLREDLGNVPDSGKKPSA